MDSEILYGIWLTLVFGFSSGTAAVVSGEYGSSENACRELFMTESGRKKLSAKQRELLRVNGLSAAEKIYENAEALGISIMTADSPEYPQPLSEIETPPFLLYYKGDISRINDRPLLGVVGTRNPTNYSRHIARSLTRDLARCGFGIVSGFAVGIDITAHCAACEGRSDTYAVIGCGIDMNYPRENFEYRPLIEAHGAFISEYPPGFKAQPWTFPIRNRILAGMTCGVIVIEAGAASGSLVTAKIAIDQGKTVFTVPPGDLFDKVYAGNVRLLRNGIPCIMSARDAVNEFFPDHSDRLTPVAAAIYNDAAAERSFAQIVADSIPPAARKDPMAEDSGDAYHPGDNTHPGDNSEKEDTAAADKARFESLPAEQKKLAVYLAGSERPLTADEIAVYMGYDISDMLILLTEMELDGIISCGAGKTYTVQRQDPSGQKNTY